MAHTIRILEGAPLLSTLLDAMNILRLAVLAIGSSHAMTRSARPVHPLNLPSQCGGGYENYTIALPRDAQSHDNLQGKSQLGDPPAPCTYGGGCLACALTCGNFGYYCCLGGNCCCFTSAGNCDRNPACPLSTCIGTTEAV